MITIRKKVLDAELVGEFIVKLFNKYGVKYSLSSEASDKTLTVFYVLEDDTEKFEILTNRFGDIIIQKTIKGLHEQ